MNQIHTTIKGGKVVPGDFVRWNGTADQYYGDTSELKTSEIYRIVDIEIRSFSTNLILQETSTGTIFEASFNALLFQKVEIQNAIASRNPWVGYRYDISKVVMSDGHLAYYPGTTSRVIARYHQGNSNWYVVTRNSVYNVMVVLPDYET